MALFLIPYKGQQFSMHLKYKRLDCLPGVMKMEYCMMKAFIMPGPALGTPDAWSVPQH
ncbi:MAG: hypothetical protein ACTHMI_04185 [Mucilaginibacter sp.]